MFKLLDDSLKGVLQDAAVNAAFPALFSADVSFVTPEKPYLPAQETLNLFLYETRENRELRDLTPLLERQNGVAVRRRAPLRVDCLYMVTAWSHQNGALKVAAEHQLLGYAFNWLSRFPVIPQQFLVAAGMSGQDFDPPTLVAQMDPVKNIGEFWTALGIAPRPFFDLVVTITMDLEQSVGDSIVTTVSSNYLQTGSPGSVEELLMIGGTVRDQGGSAVANAWVRLEPAGSTQVADNTGRFIFSDLRRGTGFSLRALAPGQARPATLNNFEIPSLSGTYDLQFT